MLLAAFPNFRLQIKVKHLLDAYYPLLCDLDTEMLAMAAAHVASEATFFPVASEIRKTAFHLAEVAAGIPSAQDAWAEVTKAVQRGGFYDKSRGYWQQRPPQTDDWSHPLIEKAIDAVGGFHALRTSDNVVADRARFLEAYDRYVERHRESDRMLPNVQQAVRALADGQRSVRALPEGQRAIEDTAESMRF